LEEMSWDRVYRSGSAVNAGLKDGGGEEVVHGVALIPNSPESVIAFLGSASMVGIWYSCSPGCGRGMVINGFKLIGSTALVAVDGYRYNGKDFHRMDTVSSIQQAVPSLKKTIILSYLDNNPEISNIYNAELWNSFMNQNKNVTLSYEQVSFDHPLWILFSS